MNDPISEDLICFIIEHSVDSIALCNSLCFIFENM